MTEHDLLAAGDARSYWADQLEGAPTALQLPTDRPRPTRLGPELGAAASSLPAPVVDAAEQLADGDVGRVLLAGWIALLARYAGQDDIVVGCGSSSGVSGPEDAVVIVRVRVTAETTFGSLVQSVADQLRDGAAAGPVTVPELMAALGVEPGAGKHPFFQVAFIHHDRPLEEVPVISGGATAPCDVVLRWTRSGDGVALRLDHSAVLFEPARAAAMATHLQVLLEGALAAPEQPLRELPILTDEDRERLARWNATQHPHRRDRPLAALFAEQVARTPDAHAVELDGEVLTYAALDARAGQIARALRQRGVGPDTRVAIAMERSVDLVTAVLAVLQAGGAYVPIDPGYPEARRTYMLESSGVEILLVRPGTPPTVGAPSPAVALDVDELAGEGACEGASAPALAAPASTGDDLGYVIYTSGSTGRPKAVALPQRALTNLVEWQLRRPGFAAGARTLQFSSLSFDVSFQELFTTWCSGGTLVLVPDATRRDPRALLDHLVHHDVERIFVPFVALRGLADAAVASGTYPVRLREVYTAGEQLQVDDTVRAFFEALPGCTLENQYGPSESHVVTAHRLLGEPATWPALPPIGAPIANTSAHIVDADLQPCPPGVSGELLIGGVCLAREYLGDPERTAERFIEHPLAGEGGRLYRTGDLTRWRDDGVVEFLGRADDQVKFRGFRIEPGEVGAVLSSFPGVRQCVATVVDVAGAGARLAAYVVPADDAEISLGDLHYFARSRLPDYMVPSHVVLLDSLPLTPSGKVDLQNLPEPVFDRAILSAGYVAPRTPEEEALVRMWSSLLGIDRIGVDDDFFELGGDSLMAVELFAMMKERFDQELPLGALAQSPTIAGLARSLTSGEAQWSSLVPLRPEGTVPPLFCVHGGTGNVASFPKLARALPDHQPVYALQWDGLDGQRGSRTVPAMARTYLERVLEVQPVGPYRLAGQCVGGLIAREMTSLLQERGEDVELLVMYDSPNLDSPHFVVKDRIGSVPAPLRGVANRGVGVASSVLGLRTRARDRREVVTTRIRSTLRRPVPQQHRELYGSIVMTSATWRYRVRRLDVPTLYIHSGRTNAREIALTGRWTDGMLGWTDHVSDSFRVHRVVAEHNEILYQPRAIELLTEALSGLTGELDQQGSGTDR